ncbi:MAG: recombinase family protein [Ruminococcus sp.]|nr:recombinase family protein [Ruminococcus sp.]
MWYSRDISKKVRSMIRQKGNSGQSITSKLPYGYRRSTENKDEWIIDEFAADVVRRIFDLYLNKSLGVQEISRILEADKIPIPHYHRLLANGAEVDADRMYKWNYSVVRNILMRQEYVGDTVNFRSEIKSYKDKRKVKNSADKIRIFPDTHPAIIDRETFQKIQDKYEKSVRHRKSKHDYSRTILREVND